MQIHANPNRILLHFSNRANDNDNDDDDDEIIRNLGEAKVTSQTGQDLLTWCQHVTSCYAGVKVTDLTLSFRSGLALCAILHHFQPEAM